MSQDFEQPPTISEVYRLCERIEEAVKEQNGRVRKLENQVKVLWLGGVGLAGLGGAWVKQKLGL